MVYVLVSTCDKYDARSGYKDVIIKIVTRMSGYIRSSDCVKVRCASIRSLLLLIPIFKPAL